MQGQYVSLPPWIYQILMRSAMAGTYITFMQITHPFQVLTEPLCLAWGVFLFAVEQQVGDQITWAGSECFFLSVVLPIVRSKLDGICRIAYSVKQTGANLIYPR